MLAEEQRVLHVAIRVGYFKSKVERLLGAQCLRHANYGDRMYLLPHDKSAMVLALLSRYHPRSNQLCGHYDSNP